MPTIQPSLSYIDGQPLLTRTRAVVCAAGQAPTIAFVLQNRDGTPVDLTPQESLTGISVSAPIQFRAAEAIGGPNSGMFSYSGQITDATNGGVSAAIPVGGLSVPGVYDAAFAAYGADGAPAVVNEFYLVLERNLFSGQGTGLGPPRIDEVRMHVRDSSAAENRLLEGFPLFDDAEIAMALVKTVRAWNATTPPVAPFTTATFPREFQLAWLEGATAQLLYTASEWYRKNYLTVQGAGGVAVADMDKADGMLQSAERRWQNYIQWVTSQKTVINMSRMYGVMGSSYRFISFGTVLNP